MREVLCCIPPISQPRNELGTGCFCLLWSGFNVYQKDETKWQTGPYIGRKGEGKSMLVVNIQNLGDTSVFRCIGRIVAGEEVATLKRAVLCHQESKTLVLDLSEVSTLDGAGLGLLAFFVGWTRLVGITLKVMNPTSHVQRLLELTNLDSVLEICDWSCIPATISHPATAIATTSEAVVHG